MTHDCMLNHSLFVCLSWTAAWTGPPSAVWQENTQIRPEEMMTHPMWRVLKKNLIRSVMCLRGFRPWRLALVPVRPVPPAFRLRNNTYRTGLSIRTLPHRSRSKNQSTMSERASEPLCASGPHAQLSDQIWSFPLPYLEMYVTQESI